MHKHCENINKTICELGLKEINYKVKKGASVAEINGITKSWCTSCRNTKSILNATIDHTNIQGIAQRFDFTAEVSHGLHISNKGHRTIG
jgi:hypothetical protein